MSHLNLRYNTLPGIVITVCILLLPITSFAHIAVDCNSSFVKPHPTQLIIDVLPTGTDDTENIQCALNAAVQKGVPVVRLAKGDFAISNILVKNFKGSLQGTTRADTHLTILDNSIDCATMLSQGLISAALKFSGGEPKLIRRAIGHSTFDAAARDPDAKAVWIVVAAVNHAFVGALLG